MDKITDLESLSLVISSQLEGSHHDATLLVEGEKIPVHKIILASWSNYFKELFQVEAGPSSSNSNTQEEEGAACQDIVEIVQFKDVKVRSTDVYELSNVKAEAFKSVLHYVYSGTYLFQGEVQNHLLALELAHLYNLESLETKLAKHLKEYIDVENFVDFFNMKTQIQNDELENSCLDLLKKKGEEIASSDNFPRLTLDSLLSLLDDDSFATTEMNIFRAAEKWANVNKPNQETINAIVKKIRLATMSKEDLFVVVAASEDLPSIDILEPIKSITMKDEAFHNSRQPSETVPTSNVILVSRGATATGGLNSMDCIDDNLNRSWAHLYADVPLLICQREPSYLSSVRILIDAHGNSYTIESSPDGESWQLVWEEAPGDVGEVWHNCEFSKRAVMQFRIKMKGTDHSTKNCIYVYCFESPASTIPVTSEHLPQTS